ncbi:unnamed protein product [Cladocopium goreaui]|uniref:MBD domain-containing protein n=1 Tax=Cladocopium goreaui TaxID=2562237 RepID=A0A9P1DHN9_9DINO|nr:unnamed protein product [Cladocopium goreaui]
MDERMKEDVRQLQTFLTNQERLLSKEQFEQLRETQYQSVLKRVGSHRMGWEGINALSGLIETGPWTDEPKAGLGMALGECSKDVASCGKKSRPNQVCPDFTPFWSQEDVLVLRAPETSLVGKLEQIAARLVKIGMMWASELCYGEIMRSAQSLGLCVDNFTENLKQLKSYVRRRRRHVKLDDSLFQQKFVTLEDIKVPEPYQDSPCAELVTKGKDRSTLFSGHLRGPKFLDKVWCTAIHFTVGLSFRKEGASAATSLALALPGAEKSALAPLKPLFDLLAPLLEQANAPRSSKGHGAGLANLQIFPGKRPGREPSRSPRSEVSEANDSQEQQPLQAAPAPSPMTMMVPAKSKQPDEPGMSDEEYEPEQDAKLFAKAKEDRKRKRLEEKTAKAKAKASASKETEKEEDSCQEDEASAAKAETEKPVKANAAKKTRQVPRVFTGPERPPIMKDGDPTTHYLQGKVHRNSGCKKFRVFLQAGDRQDKAVSYKNDESAAWATCCKLIEEHAKKLAAENVD